VVVVVLEAESGALVGVTAGASVVVVAPPAAVVVVVDDVEAPAAVVVVVDDVEAPALEVVVVVPAVVGVEAPVTWTTPVIQGCGSQ
jgi:hypothetical protein